VPEVWAAHVAPLSALLKTAPNAPTAKQMEVVGQLTPPRKFPPVMVIDVQVVPLSDVRHTIPELPTPTQVVALAQLSEAIAMELPAVWAVQTDALVVARIRPSADPAKHAVVPGQLMAYNALPVGNGFCQLHVPPAVAMLGLTPVVGRVVAGLGIDGDGAGFGALAVGTEVDAGAVTAVAATPSTGHAAAKVTSAAGRHRALWNVPPTPRKIVFLTQPMSMGGGGLGDGVGDVVDLLVAVSAALVAHVDLQVIGAGGHRCPR
jgi:hypothetical protein